MLSTATPAQANHDRDFKRFLGAAVGLYILGQAIEHQNYKHRKTYRTHNKQWHHNKTRYNPCGQYRWDRRTNTCYRYR